MPHTSNCILMWKSRLSGCKIKKRMSIITYLRKRMKLLKHYCTPAVKSTTLQVDRYLNARICNLNVPSTNHVLTFSQEQKHCISLHDLVNPPQVISVDTKEPHRNTKIQPYVKSGQHIKDKSGETKSSGV